MSGPNDTACDSYEGTVLDRCRRCQQCVCNRLACQGEHRQGHLSDRHFLVQPQTVDRPGIGDIAACLGSLASGDLLKRRHDVVAQSDPARSAPQVGDVRSDAYTVGSPHPPLEGQVDFAATASTWRVNPRCFILKLRLPARSPYFAAGVRRTSARARSLCQSLRVTPPADSQSWRFRFSWWIWGLWSAQLTRRRPRTAAFWGPLRAHQREGQQELGWNVVTLNRHFQCLRYPP